MLCVEVEKRLLRDLRRTKALLQDAQAVIEKLRETSGNKATIKQLRHQVTHDFFHFRLHRN